MSTAKNRRSVSPAAPAAPAAPAGTDGLSKSAPAAPAAEPAPAAPAAADKAALMAELMAELGEAIDRPDGDCGPARRAAEAIRCHWSPEVTQAAAAAAVRLPGLFPARGDGPKTAEKIGCSAAYVWRPKKGGALIPTRKGDVALQGIFRASKRISNGETLTLDWLLTCVEATRKFCILKEATQPDWLDNLVVTESMKKSEGIGLQTSLLYQLAKQSGRTVAITSDETVMAV
jgi:hypothetical protein